MQKLTKCHLQSPVNIICVPNPKVHIHKIRLMPVSSQESERSCICVLEVSISPLFLRFSNRILELFGRCDIFFNFSCYWSNCYNKQSILKLTLCSHTLYQISHIGICDLLFFSNEKQFPGIFFYHVLRLSTCIYTILLGLWLYI